MENQKNDILDDIAFQNEGLSADDEQLMRIFIQQRADEYIEFEKSGKLVSLDWMKMLVGLPWLLYRKMYGPALVLFSIMIPVLPAKLVFATPAFGVVSIVADLIQSTPRDLFSYIFMPILILLTMIVACGLFSKRLYIWHVKNEIAKTKDRYSADQVEKILGQKGGVEGVLPSMLIFVMGYLILDSLSDLNNILMF